MLSFITDLFPAVYAEESQETPAEAAEEAAPAAEEEAEEPEDIKPSIEDGKCPFIQRRGRNKTKTLPPDSQCVC